VYNAPGRPENFRISNVSSYTERVSRTTDRTARLRLMKPWATWTGAKLEGCQGGHCPPKLSAWRHATTLKSYTDHWQLPLLQNWPLQWPPQMKMSGSAPAPELPYKLINLAGTTQQLQYKLLAHNKWATGVQ